MTDSIALTGATGFVGAALAKACLEKNIKKVALDRSGYRYHGRVSEIRQRTCPWKGEQGTSGLSGGKGVQIAH